MCRFATGSSMHEGEFCRKSFVGKVTILTDTPSHDAVKNYPFPHPELIPQTWHQLILVTHLSQMDTWPWDRKVLKWRPEMPDGTNQSRCIAGTWNQLMMTSEKMSLMILRKSQAMKNLAHPCHGEFKPTNCWWTSSFLLSPLYLGLIM